MEVTLLDVVNQVAAIAQKLDGIEGRLTAHVDKQLAAAVQELKHQAQLHKEELKDEVKKAAEGYAATLKKIDRELGDLNRKVENGFRDHALSPKGHSKRLTALEKRRARPV